MIDVIPLPRQIGADVRLVLMIAGDHLDLHAVRGGIEIFDRQLGSGDRSRPADVGIKTRHVGQDADLDDVVVLRARGGGGADEGGERQRECASVRFASQSHAKPPQFANRMVRASRRFKRVRVLISNSQIFVQLFGIGL